MTNPMLLPHRLRCVDPMDQWASIEERCNLAADELARLSRIEIKYDNLCPVLNEQAGEIGRLTTELAAERDDRCGAIERRDQQLMESVDHETEYMAEIQRLQRALCFWLPHMPAEPPTPHIDEKLESAIWLLAGYNGPIEAGAEELGWIKTCFESEPVADHHVMDSID